MTTYPALRCLFALVAAGVLSAFAVMLVTGRYRSEGPVLLTLTVGHGLHRGDVLVLIGWAAGVLSLLGLLVPRRR